MNDGAFYRMVRVRAGSSVQVVTGIPPGRYYLDHYRFRENLEPGFVRGGNANTSGERGPRQELDFVFSLEAATLTISPAHFRIVVDRIDKEAGSHRLSVDVQETDSEARARTLEYLRGSGNLSHWQVRH